MNLRSRPTPAASGMRAREAVTGFAHELRQRRKLPATHDKLDLQLPVRDMPTPGRWAITAIAGLSGL